MKENPEDLELFHYGVKGMKWGVRRDEALLRKISGQRFVSVDGKTRAERKAAKKQLKTDWKNYKKTTSKEQRRLDRNAAQQEKLKYLIDSASKEPMRLIKTVDRNGYPTHEIGELFVERMMSGSAVNINATELSDLYIDLP